MPIKYRRHSFNFAFFVVFGKNLVSYIGFELLFGSGPFPSEGITLQCKRKSEKEIEKEGHHIAISFFTRM